MKLKAHKVGQDAWAKGVTIRFSLRPARFGATGHVPAREPWSYLRYWIRANSHHSTRVAAGVFLDQSESFAKAAQSASIDTAPLLWYYSFLNLAKCYLAASNKESIADLGNARHGIGEPGGNAGGYLKLSKQKVSVWSKRDTKNNLQIFPALCDALNTPLPVQPVSIKELLGRIVSIHQAYCTALAQTPRFFRCVRPSFRNAREPNGKSGDLWCRVSAEVSDRYASRLSYNNFRNLIESSTPFRACTPIRGRNHTFETKAYGFSNKTFEKKLSEIKEKLAPCVHPLILPTEYRYYLYAGEVPRIHQAAAIYAFMFYLGSIVRYQPHRFDKLIQKKEQWVVAEFLKVCPKQFVMLMANEITATDMAYVEGL